MKLFASLNLSEWESISVIVGAVIAAVAAAYRTIVKPLAGVFDDVKELKTQVAANVATFAKVAVDVKDLNAQMSTNGGTTLRDAVNRIERNQSGIADRLTKVEHK